MKIEIRFELNGVPTTVEVAPHARLLDLLRDTLGETGTKEGCGDGECGACTVIVDGDAINSCIFPALEVDGCSVLTIEGLASNPGGVLCAEQAAFLELGGAQCGFCTPGMVMAAVALLDHNPDPTDDEICDSLTGNLCRCTGYVQIIDSIRLAAQMRREAAKA